MVIPESLRVTNYHFNMIQAKRMIKENTGMPCIHVVLIQNHSTGRGIRNPLVPFLKLL